MPHWEEQLKKKQAQKRERAQPRPATCSLSERFLTKWQEFKQDMRRRAVAVGYFVFAAVAFWILLQLLVWFYDFNLLSWVFSLPYVEPTFRHVFAEITAKTGLGVFYMFLFASLFFLPVPLEILYIGLAQQGTQFTMLFVMALTGLVAGQHINYVLGKVFGRLLRSFIKRKTRKNTKEMMRKYGVYGVLGVHILPLPFPLINFIVGATKFSYLRWLSAMIVGITIHFGIVHWLAVAVF